MIHPGGRIGCTQGHSTGAVIPSEISHQLSLTEALCLGVPCYRRQELEFFANFGLVRSGRDSLHFMYENDGSAGYITKAPGTQLPRYYRNAM